ncbi:hypothetical protein E6O75_ATG03298 [Venturia nashicola]|uniref:F-box domain-containing protein n=1 Tax=Venturia nashicola TaxID=86259 RepID=A0A4Z1PME8_9PEZI|nr:hypothetical protein E6O75_ATG03298 [Venturia nashicola]
MSCFLDFGMRPQTPSFTTFNSNGKRPSQGPNPFAKRFLYMMNSGLDEDNKIARPTTESKMIDNCILNSQKPVKGSFMKDLPAELRIRIMEYLLVDQPKLLATVHHYHQGSTTKTTTRTVSPPSGTYHPLHMTCKSLHQEFSKIQSEQATHIFHQPPAQNGEQDPHWFTSTATHPIRHIKVIVEHNDDHLQTADVMARINNAFTLLHPSYCATFPEAQDINFIHVFRDPVNKSITGITPHPNQHTPTTPFSRTSKFDFWMKTERAPADVMPGGTTDPTDEGILSINHLYRLPTLFPQMVRFDVDWTVTHTSALGRLRFQARNIARLISEAMKGFVDLGAREGAGVDVGLGVRGGEGEGEGERKRATLQLRSINSDYGGTTQDLDFDTDRNM